MSDSCFLQHSLNIHPSGVVAQLFGCYMAGATWNCCHLGTFCVHHTTVHHIIITSLHAKQHEYQIVYMYVCVHVHVCGCVFLCAYMCVDVHICMCVCMQDARVRSKIASGRYHSQYYTNGSKCDLTGKGRETEVRVGLPFLPSFHSWCMRVFKRTLIY